MRQPWQHLPDESGRLSTLNPRFKSSVSTNIVNRITAGGHNGVQLEQSEEARDGFWKQIAGAVACVYRSKLNVKTFSAGGSA